MRRLMRDLARTAVPLLLGILMIYIAEPLARMLGLPALAPASVVGGMTMCGAALTHPLRRLLFPYLDLGRVMSKATETSDGAGRVVIGVCIVLGFLLMTLGSSARAGTLPPNAERYLPVLVAEQQTHWPGMPMPSALAAQVEQETCISLKHPRCWSPRAELRTMRERGVGLGQITRTTRFDSLAELRGQFPRQLAGWAWDDDSLYDPRLQLRALVLMDLRNWGAIRGTASSEDRLAMTLAAYNGGLGGLVRDRALCGGTPGCDPRRWVGHTERTCTKAKTTAPGYGRSWCDINREYPRNIMGPRRGKYLQRMGV